MKTKNFINQISNPTEIAYSVIEEIASGSALVEECERDIMLMIKSLQSAGDKLVCLRLDGETKLT